LRASVTDAEGVNTLREGVLPVLLALIIGRVITRPKPIAVTVDADKPSPKREPGGWPPSRHEATRWISEIGLRPSLETTVQP